MGFRLGTALGKAFGAAIGHATHGLVRVNFQRPSRPAVAPTDSTVTSTSIGGGAIYSRRVVNYSSPPTVPYDNSPTDSGGPGMAMQPAGACAVVWDGKRYVRLHPNKSGFVTRGGGTSKYAQGLQYHPPGSVCVKSRRMNPGNGHAALHALRRIMAFHHLAKHVEKVMHRVAAKHGASRAVGGGVRRKKGCTCGS